DHAAAAKLVNDDVLTIPLSEDGRTPNVKSLTTEDIKGKAPIKIVCKSKTLKKGKKATLKVEAPGYAASDIKWTSSKKSVATVKATKDKFKATVKAIKAGKAKITVKVADETKTITVKVK
ncbi:MAG: Ig-like domain-containing protein, partial [Acetivibrio sp.]